MKQAVLIISLLLMFITGICAWWFWHDMQTQLNAPLKLDARIDFTIKPGTGLRTVTHELKNMGLMYQPYYLLIEARRQGKESRIKAGVNMKSAPEPHHYNYSTSLWQAR